jgi:DNA-binding XRE family transcriptional regulator
MQESRSLKKPRKTEAKRETDAKPDDDEPTNKPFAERFPSRTSATAKVLGGNVRRLRTDLDLSQADLAKAIRADQSTIGLIELERGNPTLLTIEKLAKVLRTTVPELLSKPPRGRSRPSGGPREK